jgi:branched-chain amino acid transport system ATP-binding protein
MGAYVRRDRDGVKADVERVFTLFRRLKERRRQTAGTLSGGEQQNVGDGTRADVEAATPAPR